ncbi:MAG: Wzz/FepE/Etk N-terminal domain-containing protein [Bacteroidota bacterium]
MQDRPDFPTPADRPSRPSADVHDAVFEEVVFSPTPPEEWRPAEPVEPLPEPRHSGDGAPRSADALGYDERGGFRIAPDAAERPAAQTAALAPVRREVPAPAGPASTPPPAPPPEPPRVQARRAFRDRMQMLRRHKWLALTVFLLTLGAFAAYAFLAPPTYEAYSVLLINPNQAASTSELAAALQDAPGEEGGKVLNQAIILQQNPQIAERTAQMLLDQPAAEALGVVRETADAFGPQVTAESLGEYLQTKVVTITPEGDEIDAIRVQAESGDAQEAALIAGIYTDQYLALSRQSGRSTLTETRALLESQLMTREGELAEIEAQLEAFMTSENVAGLEIQTQNAVSLIGTLENQLDLARAEVSQRQATLAQLERESETVGSRLAESSNASSTTVQDTQNSAEIARLETLLNQAYVQNPELRGNPNSHPDTRAIYQRIQALRAEQQRLAQERAQSAVNRGGLDLSSPGANGASYIADLQRRIADERSALQGARARAGALSGRLSEARSELREKPGQEVELTQLRRQRDAAEEAAITLRRQLDQAEIADETELAVAQVIRPVTVPRKPASPNLPLLLGLGGVLGLLLGLAAAAARYTTDSRAHTAAEVQAAGFAVVGSVPDLTEALRRGRQTVEGVQVHPGLVTVTEAFSREAEAFRHLHAALHAGGASPQVVLATAPTPGTGTSLVTANLAAAAAQAGRRVLLIDADLRTPAVSALLGLGESPALGAGEDNLNIVYWSTVVPGLFAVTAREKPDAPGHAWAPERVGALLGDLRGTFDLVLLDTPAALRTADAALLAPHADAALLIAEAGETDLDAMQSVARDLAGAGLTRIGAVMNRAETPFTSREPRRGSRSRPDRLALTA